MADAQIGAVANRVLCDQHDLLRARLGQLVDLAHHVAGPLGNLAALDDGDGAEVARVVAAVRYLDVGARSGGDAAERGEHALAAGHLCGRQRQQLANHSADRVPFVR